MTWWDTTVTWGGLFLLFLCNLALTFLLAIWRAWKRDVYRRSGGR